MDEKYLRDQIDSIDEQMMELLERRMEVVCAISAIKQSQGTEIFVPAREVRVLRMAAKGNYRDSKRSLMESLLAISREYQTKLRKQPDLFPKQP